MSIDQKTLNIVERAHLVAEVVDDLTDMRLAVASAQAADYDGMSVQVLGGEDAVDRAAEHFDLPIPDDGLSSIYLRAGAVRGVGLRIYSSRTRPVPACTVPEHATTGTVLGSAAEEEHDVEVGPFTDEHGFDRTPGQWPIGGAL
ncbi:hypothetical protein [Knoellia sp. LjRoot47]|uniref:hypothetical protein n=1 Tax=Knoellia sp. LjRoot47 TaxID=3342330 RepID=UPI003ECCEA02